MSGTQTSISQVLPSYLYAQYQDDSDLQAFVESYNSIAQGYLDWFNATPLGVYTSPAISGPLLDWIGQGVYGIARPVISTNATSTSGAYNTSLYNVLAFNRQRTLRSGTSQVVSDDIYKRVLTWHTYRGDGQQFSTAWLKRRLVRFLYGANGSDAAVEQRTNVTQNPTMAGAVPGTYGSVGKLPTGWTRGGWDSAVTLTIVGTGVEDGIPYIDLQYSGTPASVTSQVLWLGPASNSNVALGGQFWRGSSFVKVVAGSLANVASIQFQVNNTGGSPTYRNISLTPNGNALNTQFNRLPFTLPSGATAISNPILIVNGQVGNAMSLTLRLGGPRLEQSLLPPPMGLVNTATHYMPSITPTHSGFSIDLPTTSASQTLAQLIAEGMLALPLQYAFSVTVG